MQNVKFKKIMAIAVLSLFLTGADGGNQDREERVALQDQQPALRGRIEVLRQEQDFLVFRKAMSDADSKYLIIDMKNRTGRLKYKNRVLKDFRLRTSKNFRGNELRSGMLKLTKKVEGRNDQHALVFGEAFVLQWKRDAVPRREAGIPVISLKRKELLSIFYNVEEGSLAYLVR